MRNFPNQKNQFTGGMNQDATPEKLPANEYLEAQNLRIEDTETDAIELSSHTHILPQQAGRKVRLTNIRGDELYFSIPDVPEHTRQYGCTVEGQTTVKALVTIPAQRNLVIIGWDATPTELVLITTSADNAVPPTTNLDNYAYPPLITSTYPFPNPLISPSPYTPSVAQVWRIDITDQEATTITLTVDVTGATQSDLKYSDYLNHYLVYQCDVEYLVESDCIRRVFWTDNFGRPKNLEVHSDFFITDIDPLLLDVNPSVHFGTVDFLGYGNGILPEGVYQYTYRYVTKDGNVTPWFPLSRKVILAGNNNAETYIACDGEDLKKPSVRSIILRVNDIDVRYQKIEVAYAYSIAPELVLETNIFAQRDISGLIGNCEGVPLQPNTLIFEHIENRNKFGIVVTASEIAVPKFTIESAKSVTSANNRLFYANFCEPKRVSVDTKGITWRFTPYAEIIAQNYSDENESDTGNPLEHKIPVGHNKFSGIPTPPNFNKPINIPLGQDFMNFKGGKANYYTQGYWRDEYYRFGIMLYYKDGTTGFVDRIYDRATNLDIKFPDIRTIPLTDFIGGANGDWYTNNVGIAFDNIDLSSVAHLINGFSIVRAKRTDFDKTIRCEGLVSDVYNAEPIALEVPPSGSLLKDIIYPFLNLTQITPGNFAPANNPRHVNRTSGVVWMLSPELDFLKTQIEAQDTIETVCVFEGDILIGINIFGGNAYPSLFLKAYLQNNDDPSVGNTAIVASSKWFDVAENGFVYTNHGGTTKTKQITLHFGSANDFVLGAGTAISLTSGGTFSPIIFGVYDYTQFPQPFFGAPTGGRWIYCTIKYPNATTLTRAQQIYGGQDETAVANTQWIPTGHYQPITDDPNTHGTNGDFIYDRQDVWGGDTFVNLYSRFTSFQTNPGAIIGIPYGKKIAGSEVIFPVQTQINTDLRYDLKDADKKTIKGIVEREVTKNNKTQDIGVVILLPPNGPSILTGEAFLQNDVYNLQESLQFFTGRPIDFEKNKLCSNCFPNHIIASRQKTSGEIYNSWTFLLSLERAELEVKHQGITNIDSYSAVSRQLMFWQEGNAFGMIPIDTQSLKVSTTAEAQLGTGRLFGQAVYKSETVGCKHKWSILRTEQGWYWWDDTSGELYAFKNGALDNISSKNMGTWFHNHVRKIETIDNPIYLGGINLGWDYAHSDLLVSYHAPRPVGDEPQTLDDWTIVFNETVNKWISFYSFYPRMYIDLAGGRLLTPNPNSIYLGQYVHVLFRNQFYNYFYGLQRVTSPQSGTPEYNNLDCTYITYVINKGEDQTKLPSHIEARMNPCWNRIEMISNPQYDRYNGEYLLRGQILTDQFEARGGKWQGDLPEATDQKYLNPLGTALQWYPNSIITRMQAEYAVVKVAANIQSLDANGTTIFDFKRYSIYEIINYFTISKRNT